MPFPSRKRGEPSWEPTARSRSKEWGLRSGPPGDACREGQFPTGRAFLMKLAVAVQSPDLIEGDETQAG